MIRHNDGPIDGIEQRKLADLAESARLQSSRESKAWSSTILLPENRGEQQRIVRFVLKPGMWRKPRLVLCGNYVEDKWSVSFNSGPLRQVHRVDSELCKFLDTLENADHCASDDAMLCIHLPFAQENEISLPPPCAPDCIEFDFHELIDTSDVALLVDTEQNSDSHSTVDSRIEKQIVSFQTEKTFMRYDSNGIGSISTHFSHLGNCLLIHVDGGDAGVQETAFDEIKLFFTKANDPTKEILFVSADAEAIAIKGQPGWFALPMSAEQPQDVLNEQTQSTNNTLSASQCDNLRVEFSTNDHADKTVVLSLYWRHYNIQRVQNGTKGPVFVV